MFSHVTAGARDLGKLGRFQGAGLAPLGPRRRGSTPAGGPPAECWARPGEGLPRFYVRFPIDGRPSTAGNGRVVAFAAPSPAAVDAGQAACLATGGADGGASGARPRHPVGFHGASLRDAENNKLRLVHRGELAG